MAWKYGDPIRITQAKLYDYDTGYVHIVEIENPPTLRVGDEGAYTVTLHYDMLPTKPWYVRAMTVLQEKMADMREILSDLPF